MESNWRLTAWDSGWSWEDVYLCSRVHSGPFTGYYLTTRFAGSSDPTKLTRLGPGNYIYAGTYPNDPLKPHFPYGADVDPD